VSKSFKNRLNPAKIISLNLTFKVFVELEVYKKLSVYFDESIY